MSRGYHAQAITNPDIEALAKIRAWAAKQQNLNPAVDVVLEDLIEQLEAYKKNGAIVRVRAKNLGRSPTEKAILVNRQAAKDAKRERHDARYRAVIHYRPTPFIDNGTRLWTQEEHDRLRALFAENLSDEAIGEQLDRTVYAVEGMRRKLGLCRETPNQATRYAAENTLGDPEIKERHGGIWVHAEKRGRKNLTPLQRVKAVAQRRNQQERIAS